MNTRADNDEYKLTTYGLAADGKPENVPNGHLHVEMDTGKEYRYDEENGTWYEQPASGGGGSGLPPVETTDYDKYLHTNESTGELEWSEVEAGGGGAFIVNIVGQDSGLGSIVYTPDQTIYDTYTAYAAGQDIVIYLQVPNEGKFQATIQSFTYLFSPNLKAKTGYEYATTQQQFSDIYSDLAISYDIAWDSGMCRVTKVTFAPQTSEVRLDLWQNMAGYTMYYNVNRYVNGASANESAVVAALKAGTPVRILNQYLTYGSENTEFIFQSYSGTKVTGTRIYMDNGAMKCQIVEIDISDSATNPKWTETTKTITTT